MNNLLKLFVVYICLINAFSNNIPEAYNLQSKVWSLNQPLQIMVNSKSGYLISYGINKSCKIQFLRINLELNLKGNDFVSIKRQSDKCGLQIKNKHNLPKVVANVILCSTHQLNQCEGMEYTIVELTSNSTENLIVSLIASLTKDFTINIGDKRTDITIDEYSPVYWLLQFNDTNEDMEVKIISGDDFCMFAFIETAECSENILNPLVESERVKTITKSGTILIKNRKEYINNSLFLVFKLNDTCAQNSNVRDERLLKKKFNISFSNIDTNYTIQVSGLVSIFIIFGTIYIVVYLVYLKCMDHENKDQTNPSANVNEEKKCKIFCNWCCDEYRLDCNYIFVIAVFYGMPVMQLLWHFLKNMDDNGDFDKCYFNDLCSKPLGPIISFNNVVSNIGYAILGITFMIIVSIDGCINKNPLKSPNYGIFYALGFSLIMEGVMSGSYHICPRSDTIQFDATFMYIIGCLLNLYCAIRILQKSDNNVDIDKKSKDFFFFMAIVMLIIIVLLMVESKMTKEINVIVNAIFQSIVIAISYYKIFCSNGARCCDYFCWIHVLIVILFNAIPFVFVYLLNMGFYLSFLVAIVASSAYLLGWLLWMFREKLKRDCSNSNQNRFWFFISINGILGLVLWGIAIGIFIAKAPTDWKTTASESRVLNHDCVWGTIYDWHDLWHILSSIALFLSFVIIFCTDRRISVDIVENNNNSMSERKPLNETNIEETPA